MSTEPTRDEDDDDDGVIPYGGITLALVVGGCVYNVVCVLTRADAQPSENWTWAAIFAVVAVVSALRMVGRWRSRRRRRTATRRPSTANRSNRVITPIKIDDPRRSI